jgi:biotin carboxylase
VGQGIQPSGCGSEGFESFGQARLRSAGVESRRVHLVDGERTWRVAVTDLGLPLVVKPVVGAASRDVHLVTDAAEGWTIVRGLLTPEQPTMLAEERLHGRPSAPFGDFVSVESITHDGTSRHLAVVAKFPMARPFRELGNIWPAPLSRSETIAATELTGRALAALGVTTGITHTELKLTPAGPRIIEVNGRVGGNVSELAQRAFGFDILAMALRLARGEQPEQDDTLACSDRVYFQHHLAAPLDASRVLATFGADAVRKLPGIASYHALTRPGMPLHGVHTHGLDLMCGSADSYDEMFALVDSALARLTYVFDSRTGTVAFDGRELSRAVRTAGEGV